jgi:hypothetical protein
MDAAWDDYVARPEPWSARDVSAVAGVGDLSAEGLETLRGELRAIADRVAAAAEPLPAMREAIMDATDRVVLAEQHQGDDRTAAVLAAGALRRFSKLKFKDVQQHDWHSHYLQVAEMNCRNVAELIRKTVTGEQASFEESLREPLMQTMQQIRQALLHYPSRTPVTRSEDLVSSQSSMRLAPNRDQINRLTEIMTRRFEKLFAGQIYSRDSGPPFSPSGMFQVDAALLFTQLSLRFRRPTDAWREIMSEALGPYRAAMEKEAELLQVGELALRTWNEPGDGPLHRSLLRLREVALGTDPSSSTIDATQFASQASADAGALVGNVTRVLEKR